VSPRLRLSDASSHFEVKTTTFQIEASVSSCFQFHFRYNGDAPDITGTGYLLYTGQHYDVLVGASDQDTAVESECRLFPPKHLDSEPLALATAAEYKAHLAFLATQRVVEKIKCLGCGTILEDNQAFQTHCMDVEHDDEFAYDCEMASQLATPMCSFDIFCWLHKLAKPLYSNRTCSCRSCKVGTAAMLRCSNV
jgi:hypothetical protein